MNETAQGGVVPFDHDNIFIAERGEHHDYEIIVNKERGENFLLGAYRCDIHFQTGPVNLFGWNGITDEALLEVVLDRLRSFQAGEFRCRENACAITHIEEAQHWLHHRKRDRIRRGVEGSYRK